MAQTDGPQAPRGGAGDGKYGTLVGVLLVVIVAALAALWLLERNRRGEAERRLAEARRSPGLEALLPALTAGAAPAPEGELVAPVRREDQVQRPVVLDGKPAVGVFVSAAAGQRLGFQPGDVVVVAPAAPATATSAPGGE